MLSERQSAYVGRSVSKMEEEQGVISLGTISDEQIERLKKMLAENDCLSGIRLGVELPCGCAVPNTDNERQSEEYQ